MKNKATEQKVWKLPKWVLSFEKKTCLSVFVSVSSHMWFNGLVKVDMCPKIFTFNVDLRHICDVCNKGDFQIFLQTIILQSSDTQIWNRKSILESCVLKC